MKLKQCKSEDRDSMGVCCSDSKDYEEGSMCKNLTTIIPFVNTIDDKLFEIYNLTFNTMFENTNYIWNAYVEKTNRNKIIIKINIKKDENNHLRKLVDDIITFTDYEYAKSLLSILDCNNKEEV